MPTGAMNVVIRQLLADLGPKGDGATDGQLLARARCRDKDALAALVRRHAPMVWGVCRRLLNNHDAEDAFQATFLVLVRKAADVPGQAVAGWLYGVARQTAVRLRATAAKRGRREAQVVTMPEPENRGQGLGARGQETAAAQAELDEELGRLPDHYRGVIVLCDLEGLTRKEAARQLGVPEGSVASRLARGRALLAKRLARRGVVFSGSVAAVLSAGLAPAAAPPALVASTIRAASLLAAGQAAAISASVVDLAEGVVKAMSVTRIKAALVVVMVLGFVATGATILTGRMAAGQENPKPAAEKPVDAPAKPAKKQQEIVIAWGEESGGLQAGLGFRPGVQRVYHHGETVTLVVRVRNVGKEKVKFKYIRQFLDENPPTVTGADGKAVPQHRLSMLGFHTPVEATLEPGTHIELESRLPLRYELRPAGGPEKPTTGNRSLFVGIGKISLQYERVFGNSSAGSVELDPTLGKLATGKLELEIQPAPPKQQPDKTDQERMEGNWFIMNDDSGRKGEMWAIDKDRILMHAKNTSPIVRTYTYRLDSGKTPKEIDITVARVNGPVIGVIKGIYALDGDELRLCLGGLDKDRPAAFPEKPGPGEVLILQRSPHGATPPKPKEKPAAKTDQELMVGEWVVTSADSKAQGQRWVIDKDHILMNYYGPGLLARQYHFLDAGKDPKHIDIALTKENGPNAIKGIYALDGDELRLCLGERGKDRPAEFPREPRPGGVLILQRVATGEPPKAKKVQPVKTDQERMVGSWVIVKNDGQRNRKGEEWWITQGAIVMHPNLRGFRILMHFHRLDASKNPKQIDITVTKTNGEHVGVIKGIYAFTDDNELRLCLGEMGRERPAAFAGKPGESELLILQRYVTKEERLRVLIAKVLEAHGGEDKLNKLTSFTMTVKHSNGETQHYFVQPPKNLRWETTHRDRTGKRIVILFPTGRRWWSKEPNEEAKEFQLSGVEPTIEFWLDYVKFFGPRQVLRLKDPDHRAALLDEEATIGGRAAVGVQVTGPHYNQKMYFDKETHLLVKGVASDIVREVTFSDYKRFDDIPIARKEHDGHFDPEVTDFKVVEKFDSKLFERP